MKSSKLKKDAQHLPSTIHAAEASASAEQTKKELEIATPTLTEEEFKKLLEKNSKK